MSETLWREKLANRISQEMEKQAKNSASVTVEKCAELLRLCNLSISIPVSDRNFLRSGSPSSLLRGEEKSKSALQVVLYTEGIWRVSAAAVPLMEELMKLLM